MADIGESPNLGTLNSHEPMHFNLFSIAMSNTTPGRWAGGRLGHITEQLRPLCRQQSIKQRSFPSQTIMLLNNNLKCTSKYNLITLLINYSKYNLIQLGIIETGVECGGWRGGQ